MSKKISNIFIFGSLFCALFFSACATPQNTEDIGKSEAHSKLGYAYLRQGQLTEAYIELQKSIELNPANKESFNYLGFISTRFNKYDEAISYYNRAISIDPKFSEALNNLGVAHAKLGNWDDAIKYFNTALSNPLYRTPASAYSNMGYAYYKKGDFSKAEDALEEAIMRNPVLLRAAYILGLVYVELHDDEAAIGEFKRAVGIMPDYVDAHWELANAYFRSGERDKALQHYKVVAEQDNNTGRSREALEFIEHLEN